MDQTTCSTGTTQPRAHSLKGRGKRLATGLTHANCDSYEALTGGPGCAWRFHSAPPAAVASSWRPAWGCEHRRSSGDIARIRRRGAPAPTNALALQDDIGKMPHVK